MLKSYDPISDINLVLCNFAELEVLYLCIFYAFISFFLLLLRVIFAFMFISVGIALGDLPSLKN